MLGLVLLGLLGVGATAFVVDELLDDDENPTDPDNQGPLQDDSPQDDPETPEDGEDTEDPEEEVLETGATVLFENSVISVDVGEDETRSLLAIKNEVDTIPGAGCCSRGTDYSVDFFLVPPEADLTMDPDALLAAEKQDPDSPYQSFNGLEKADYFALQDIELIGSVSLGFSNAFEDQFGGGFRINDHTIRGVTVDANVDYDAYSFEFDATTGETRFDQNDLVATDPFDEPILEEGPNIISPSFYETTPSGGGIWDIDPRNDFGENGAQITGTDAGDEINAKGSGYINIESGAGDDTVILSPDSDGRIETGAGDDVIEAGIGHLIDAGEGSQNEDGQIEDGTGHDDITLRVTGEDFARISSDFENSTETMILNADDHDTVNIDITDFPEGNFHWMTVDTYSILANDSAASSGAASENGIVVSGEDVSGSLTDILVWSPPEIIDLSDILPPTADEIDSALGLKLILGIGKGDYTNVTDDLGNVTGTRDLLNPNVLLNFKITSTANIANP